MSAMKIGGVILIVLGAFGLAYGKFTYTKERHQAKLGPVEMTLKEHESISIPPWLGIGSILVGGAMLLFAKK